MAINKVPTLLVGLGGIGCSIANMTASMLDDETKKYVGVVGFDTNAEDLKKVQKIKTVRTSDENLVKHFLKENPEYIKWFPVNKFTVNRDMKNGAGQIRAISRLAGLASERAGRFVVLEEEIKRILKHDEDKATGAINVFVVGSITGGTGAGLFLQIPFYIKRFLKNEMAIENVHVRGMFLSADITKNVQPSTINKEAVMVNAYACMKELNAFYLTQIMKDEDIHLELDYYGRTDRAEEVKMMKKDMMEEEMNGDFGFDFDDGMDITAMEDDADAIASDGANIPYNAFYLIEGTDNKGGVGNSSLDTVKKQVSKMIYTVLFTPIKAEDAGILDNTILQDMEGGGMNRYSSAGLCSLIYPYEVVREYVTLRWVKDLVKDEWLLIDKNYESELDIAYSNQKSDPSVKLPRLDDTYIRLFKKEIEGKEGSRLGHLRGDAYIENPDDFNKPISKTSRLLKKIENEVEEIICSDDMNVLKDECKINMKLAMNIDSADKEINRVYDALEDYQRKINSTVKEYRAQIANDVFPVKESALQLKKDDPLCMYKLLVDVHPVAARFMCYDMIRTLDKKIEDLENGIASVDLMAYEDVDFYGNEKDGIQDASEAVAFIKNKNVPILNTAKKPLQLLVNKFQQMTSNQTTLVENYGKDSLLLSTYKILRERFAIMAEYYEGFFNNIEQSIKDNDERIERLEKSYVDKEYGELPVYASPDAFRMIYQDFRLKADFTLPEDTKKAIFDKIFAIVASIVENKGKEYTEEQKRRRDESIQKQLTDIFDTSIVDSLKSLVISKGKGIVDINIKQAIEKELVMNEGILNTSDATFEQKRLAYARQLIDSAMGMATPMFAVKTRDDFTETIYLGINPEAAEYAGRSADKATTKDRLVPEKTEATDMKPVSVLMEKEFSPYEIICFKSKHKYLIEDLVKYGKGSDYEQAYEKRIRNLGKEPAAEGIDAYKTVVNPHLSRFWHEEGFIPPIGIDERNKAEKETLKAFVYAMGMDLLKKEKNEDFDGRLLWHLVVGTRLYPIRKQGALIGNSYVAVYDALKFNRKVKQQILYSAQIMKKNIKGYMDAEELMETIDTTWFIEDLVQSHADEDDENFLDILIKMFSMMPREKWENLFKGLSITLEDYLSYMFDDNNKLVKKAYDQILEKMLTYSVIGKKQAEGAELTHAEKKTKEQVRGLINATML